MNKFFNFIFWPALAGLVFAATLLLTPRLTILLPGLASYFPQPTATVPLTGSTSAQFSYSEAIKRAAPAVVSINSLQKIERIVINPFLSEEEIDVDENNSLGSGVIISADGFIITSYHVVFNPKLDVFSRDITVSLNDGRNIKARIVTLDEKHDLALLKIDAEQLPFLSLANVTELQVGNVVLAIGNPRNVGQSVSFGIISALYSREDSFVIQTDAAINPGNSGGALIDINGNLIGINATIVSASGGSEGISFAIPAGIAIDLLQQYLASGPSGYLGVNGEGLTLAEGRQLFGKDVQGFRVIEVTLNSSADKAGIVVNDIITGVNDTKIMLNNDNDRNEALQAIAAISTLEPGALVMVEVFRGDEFIRLPTILGFGEPLLYDVPEQVRDSAIPIN